MVMAPTGCLEGKAYVELWKAIAVVRGVDDDDEDQSPPKAVINMRSCPAFAPTTIGSTEISDHPTSR